MKKWEYKTISQKGGINSSELNDLGIEGWELVNTIFVPNTGRFKMVFKREIDEFDTELKNNNNPQV